MRPRRLPSDAWSLHRPIRSAYLPMGAALLAFCVGTLPSQVSAQQPPVPTSSNGSKLVELRVSISPSAAGFFAESRLRRVLAIEMRDTAMLASTLSGPLGDQVGWTWIDLPDQTSVVIEARLGSQPLARRTLSIEGLGREAAARLVAIACAEMIRSLAHPARSRRAGQARIVCAEQVDMASRWGPSLVWAGHLHAVLLTAHPSWMLGPGTAVSVRFARASAGVFATWVGGRTEVGTLSWLEGGIGADYRALTFSSWRVFVGASAAAASVRFGGADAVDQNRGHSASWSARAGSVFRLERRLTDSAWLGLSVEPGAVLRPVEFQSGASTNSVGGAWLGAGISLRYEQSPIGSDGR